MSTETGLNDVFVVVELPTAHSAVEFLKCPMSLVSHSLAQLQGQTHGNSKPGPGPSRVTSLQDSVNNSRDGGELEGAGEEGGGG